MTRRCSSSVSRMGTRIACLSAARDREASLAGSTIVS